MAGSHVSGGDRLDGEPLCDGIENFRHLLAVVEHVQAVGINRQHLLASGYPLNPFVIVDIQAEKIFRIDAALEIPVAAPDAREQRIGRILQLDDQVRLAQEVGHAL